MLIILLDTNANADYFATTFHVDRAKLKRVLIGADESVFAPIEVPRDPRMFEVEFHGKYIPVQGVDAIIRAAKLLEDDREIHFTLIGGGQVYAENKALADSLQVKNITFLPFMPTHEVRTYVAKADVCFGLVGDVPRVVRAIPNKLYEAAAMGKPTINADTPALRELFTPGLDVLGVPPGDHEQIARVIRDLKRSGEANAIGRRAQETFLKKASLRCIAAELQNVLTGVVDIKAT